MLCQVEGIRERGVQCIVRQLKNNFYQVENKPDKNIYIRRSDEKQLTTVFI